MNLKFNLIYDRKLTRPDVSLLMVMLLTSQVMDGSEIPRPAQNRNTVVLAFAVVL